MKCFVFCFILYLNMNGILSCDSEIDRDDVSDIDRYAVEDER